jgi:hypothetical protein
MVKFYGYRLQHRDTDGIALFQGDRLQHQYIMNAYAAIEQSCLKYLRLNKKNFAWIFIKAFKTPSLAQVTIALLPSDKGSFCHIFSQ